MGLKEYRSKRKFKTTPEPKSVKETVPKSRTERRAVVESGLSRESRLIFVVHKHAARALHYDLRLELEGVLKSWAVPKGPSLDPAIKRLAVMVEDHPLEYKDFEGVIPEGNYGAGSVIIWDRGLYRHPSAKDARENRKLLIEGLKKGNLKFLLAGEKLRGEFALVKTGKDEKSWLLLKKRDRYATRQDILTENRSVVSHKTLEGLFVTGPENSAGKKKIGRIRLREALESTDLEDAPARPMPHSVKPMLASLAREPFDHPDWVFEVKWDGYRAIAEIRKDKAFLYSRNRISLNRKFPLIVDELRKLPFEAVFDGEIVAVDAQGNPDFQMLQNYRKSGSGHLLYYVFDLLYFQGHDLTNLALLRRKDIMKRILPYSPIVKFSAHVEKEGVLFYHAVREKGLEGIIAKQSRSTYLMGRRSQRWLKIKTRLTQEGVIAGFTRPRGSRKYFGSLVLGVFEKGELIFIGHSGGGFTAKALKELHNKMGPLIRHECPFKTVPESDATVTWVKPLLVCEVLFHGWTDEGLMRQPAFLRLRMDKEAREVTRERPRSLPS